MHDACALIRIMVLAGPVGNIDGRRDADRFWQQFPGEGVDVTVAVELDECLSRLGRYRYDAFVLDLTAPGRSLPELAYLRKDREGLLAFVLIDATDASVGHWVIHHGAAACFDIKCYNADMIRNIIRDTVLKRSETA